MRTSAQRRLVLSLAGLLAIALWLRLRNLGSLGLAGDEGIQALALRGILQEGIPVLDSGLVYARSPLFLYLQAVLAEAFGPTPFWLRFPAAVWGAVIIVPAYVLARILFDRRVGLLTAAMLAFSVWAIELSRYARFYTAFQFFFLVSLICFYRGFMLDERRYRVWFLLTAPFTFVTHRLGIVLATVLLVPVLADRLSRRSLKMVAPWALALAGVYWIQRRGTRFLASLGTVGREPPGVETAQPGLLESFRSLVGVPAVDVPGFELLGEVLRDSWSGSAALAFIALAGTVAVLWKARRPDAAGRAALAISAIAAALTHLFGLALCFMAIYVVLYSPEFQRRRDPVPRIVLGAVGACLGVWLVLLGGTLSPRELAEAFFAFPNFPGYFLRWYVVGWPVMTVVLVLGSLWLLGNFLRDRRDPVAPFLLGALYLPAVLTGLFDAYAESRYTFHLYPIVVIIVAATALRGWMWLRARPTHHPRFQGRGAAAVAVILFMFVCQDTNPLSAWRIADRTYLSARDPMRSVVSWQPYADFHQDFEEPARFVDAHRSEGDVVVVIGPHHHVGAFDFYLGGVDYMLAPADRPGYYAIARDGEFRNQVTGSVVLPGLPALEMLLARAQGAVWLLSDRRLLAENNDFYGTTLKDYLAPFAAAPDHLGRDGITFAKRLR